MQQASALYAIRILISGSCIKSRLVSCTFWFSIVLTEVKSYKHVSVRMLNCTCVYAKLHVCNSSQDYLIRLFQNYRKLEISSLICKH